MAIALDTTGNGKQAAGNTLTFTYTATGSNLGLLIGFFSATSDQAGTCSFNGTNIPQLAKVAQGGIGRWIYIYGGLITAATGNIIINGNTSSDVIVADVASYTGVSAVTAGSALQTAAATTFAMTDTTTNDNSWHAMFVRGGGTMGAGANTVVRSTTAADPDTALFDSNAAITPAGSHTLNATDGGVSIIWGGASAILSPFVATASATYVPQLLTLGVG